MLNGRSSGYGPTYWVSKAEHQVMLKGARAVLKALENAATAEGQKVLDDDVAKQQKANLATATTRVVGFEAANANSWWAFFTRPKTLWNESREKKMGVFDTIKHIFWPSSTGAKVAYAAGAATVAAGVVGGFKYAEHREDQRKSESNKKLALAAAGLAATGVAAYGGYKAWEAYQAQQEPDEYFDEAGETQTPEKENSQAVGAGSSTKKSGKTTNSKKSNWMIWAFVIVLGLAAIGGAVYYFLFLNEEGSEEDPVPEGMDQV